MGALDTALIHRARLRTTTRGLVRDAQGQYGRTLVESQWIGARIMQTRGTQPKRRRNPNSTEAEVTGAYDILLDSVDETGADFDLTPAAHIETDTTGDEGDVLGSPTLEIAGKPELLTDGEEKLGWYAQANRVEDAA